MSRCAHCSSRHVEELTADHLARVPKAWKLGQVGAKDMVVYCKECQKLTAINPITETSNKVGLGEFSMI